MRYKKTMSVFKNITGFTIDGMPQPYVDERFQYFHHYWAILKSTNRDIFFDEIWFESHRSVITKIEYQFIHNRKDSYKWFKHLCLTHPFFESNNTLAKEKSIQQYVKTIKKLVDPTGSTSENQKEFNYKTHQTDIETNIKKIKTRLFDKQDYSKTLSENLTNILSINSPLTNEIKADIRFLVIAFIVELCAYGYSLKYIEKVPDIILSMSDDFPYEKTLEDFDDDNEKYKAYIEEESKHFTLDKCFSGLVNLINRPLKDGYYIFKVENIVLLNPEPITIGEVTFYNPCKHLELNLSTAKEEWKQQYIKAEYFYSPSHDEVFDESKRSTCNAIVKSKIRSHKDIESPSELYQAFHKVSKSTEILIDVVGRYGVRIDGNVITRIRNHIKLHDSKKIAKYSFAIFYNGSVKVDMDDNENIKNFTYEIDFINRMDNSSSLSSKLFDIIGTHSKLKNSEEFFNFKDLWISWEALLTRKEMKEFAKAIFYIRYKKGYLLKIIQFLYLNLSTYNGLYKGPGVWTISDDELRRIGLLFDHDEKYYKQKFIASRHLISSTVPIEIIQDILKRVDEYLTNETLFYSNLNKWIEHTIDEVFIERNLEVHKNLRNDLSTIKLKEDFLRISSALYYELIDYSDKRNPNSTYLIMKRILAHKNRV